MELIADEDSGMQIQTLRAFLFVANNSGCCQKDVERALSYTNSSSSRNISYWTDLRFDKKPGKNFILRIEDPMDRRYSILTLTKKGKEFLEKIKSL